MRRLAIVVALLAAGAATAAPAPRVPGATMLASCAGAGPFWPTQTLAVTAGAAWVACKEESRLVRVDLATGKRRSVQLGGQPIAVLAALGAVWTLDTSGSVARLDPGTARVTGRLDTGVSRPYNLWAGAGSLWSADDDTGEVDPARPGSASGRGAGSPSATARRTWSSQGRGPG